MKRRKQHYIVLLLSVLTIGLIAYIGQKMQDSSSAATTWQTVFTENWDNLNNWTKYDNPYREDSQGPRLAGNFTLENEGGQSFARIWTRKNTSDDRLPIGDWASGGGALKNQYYREVKVNAKVRLSESEGTRGVVLLWPQEGGWAYEIDFYEIGTEAPERDEMIVSLHTPKQKFVEIYGKTSDGFPLGNHNIYRGTDARDYSAWRDIEVILLRDMMQVSVDGTVVYKTTDPDKIPYIAAPGHNFQKQDGSTYFWSGKYFLGMQTAAPGREYPGHPESGITPTHLDVGKVTVSVPTTEADDPPNVTLTSPASGDVLAGTLPIKADASDDDSTPRVTFSYKLTSGGSWTTIGTADSTPPYQVNWDTTSVPDGSYSLQAIATDGSGQSTTSDTVPVSVNNGSDTAPEVSMTVTPNDVIAGERVTVDATATDDVRVTKVEFYVGGSLMGTDEESPYSMSWQTSQPGTKRLTAKAYDAAGHVTTSDPITLTVREAPPPPSDGDVNGDGKVDVIDFSALLSHYNMDYPPADFNDDGIVNEQDLAKLLGNWTG